MKKIAGVLLLCAVVAGCKEKPVEVEDIRPVRTVIVAASSDSAMIEFSGEVRARHETALGFRVGGKLVERRVDVGAEVRAGQVLARLDTQDQGLNVAAVRAERNAAQADLAQLQLDLRRAQELLDKKFVSQAEVDRRLSAVRVAENKLEQAQAQEKLAMNQATYTSLVADSAGVVTRVDAESGQIVSAGQAVVRVARSGEREVVINVAENQRELIKIGQDAQVRLWTQPDKELTGKVREVAPAADPQSRTYAVRIALAQDVSESNVRLGMSAMVKFPRTSQSDAVNLPLSALLGEGDSHKVWLWDKESGRVSAKNVSVVNVQHEQVQVAGLQPGDVVVTAGVHLLREGQSVRRIPDPVKAGD